MTLFEMISEPESVYARVLDSKYLGQRDTETLRLLGLLGDRPSG